MTGRSSSPARGALAHAALYICPRAGLDSRHCYSIAVSVPRALNLIQPVLDRSTHCSLHLEDPFLPAFGRSIPTSFVRLAKGIA